MADPVDYYDVSQMVDAAASRLRGEIDNAIREACRQMRDEIGEERVDRQNAIEAVYRVLNSRTEHLA